MTVQLGENPNKIYCMFSGLRRNSAVFGLRIARHDVIKTKR